MSELQRICQELNISPDSDIEKVLEVIRVMRKGFVHQVLVASRLPNPEEIEGNGPAIR